MIRELIDTELEVVAGGLDLSVPLVNLSNVANTAVSLNLNPQIAVVGFAGGNALAQNFGGLQGIKTGL
ncbi:hypothetical protein QA640_44645 (plasmid) [Bradyrhizobium sp. CB82]|uniref:hypothetical protein n=1 Tax=Bradyrhizobium sp. CB82 TaxID=3039159 RepID=UPI0024B1F85A|nr:hypothetical protein [Bradyrhizobium sp. CB82]WFU45900.1 hypothetical protein QA640_44645 [Bradyrhizobium sp. CB82]